MPFEVLPTVSGAEKANRASALPADVLKHLLVKRGADDVHCEGAVAGDDASTARRSQPIPKPHDPPPLAGPSAYQDR